MNDNIKNIDISKISPDEFVEMVRYESYCLHRQRGLTHKELVNVGFPNEYNDKFENETK